VNYPYPHHTEPFWPEYTLNGLGMNVPVKVLGQTVNIDVPVEQVSAAAGTAAVAAAWPELQRRLYAELPKMVKTGLDEAQPRIREELDRATAAATSRAVMVGTALAFVVIGAAWWTRRAVKSR
jgi:hypothetical protein